MNLQSKLIGACAFAFVLLASPAVQANPGLNGASVAAAAKASNSAVQSAVRAMRDDIARREVTPRPSITR